MTSSESPPFSLGWVAISVIVILGIEIVLGDLLGRYVFGAYVSQVARLQVEGLMHLVAFLLGGFLVGVFSPQVRMMEPAVAAAIAVALTLITSLFLPFRFLTMSLERLLLGGTLAFLLALFGAYIGERLTGSVE